MKNTTWEFLAIRDKVAGDFIWHWRKVDAVGSTTSAPFAYYFDCVSNARTEGYAGELPEGPKMTLACLPVATKEKARNDRPAAPSTAKRLVMTVKASDRQRVR